MRMIEIHIKARSKVNVDSPAGRDRFLYMLSDGALILAPPGKTPYEFALHAGETAVFPAVSPTVENDTDSAVRALMVEIKTPTRSAASGRRQGQIRQGQVARARRRQVCRQQVSGGKSRSGGKPSVARSKSKSKQVAKQPQAAGEHDTASPMRRSICATPMPGRPRR